MGEERVGLVVGDEAPYLVLVRLGVKNTITTAVQVPIVRKQEVEVQDADRASASDRPQGQAATARGTATANAAARRENEFTKSLKACPPMKSIKKCLRFLFFYGIFLSSPVEP